MRRLISWFHRHKRSLGLWGAMLSLFVMTGCDSVPKYNQNEWSAAVENCWPCALYGSIFTVIDKLLDGLLESMAQNAMVLLQLGLLFWIVFQMGKYLVNVQDSSGKVMSDVFLPFLTVLFKAMMVAVLLSNIDFLYEIVGEIVIQPIMNAFLEASRIILSSTDEVRKAVTIPVKISNLITGVSGPLSGEYTPSPMFGTVALQVQDIIYRIYAALISGFGLGFSLLMRNGLAGFFIGLFVIYAFFVMLITIPFMFVDAFIRAFAVILLSPFLFVGWVFPTNLTKDTLKKGWSVLFGAIVNVLFACIFIAIFMSILSTYGSEMMPGVWGRGVQTSDAYFISRSENLGVEILSMLLLVFSMFYMVPNIASLASAFGGSDAPQNMSKVVLSGAVAATGLTMAVAGGPTAMVGSAVQVAGNKIAEKTGMKKTGEVMAKAGAVINKKGSDLKDAGVKKVKGVKFPTKSDEKW